MTYPVQDESARQITLYNRFTFTGAANFGTSASLITFFSIGGPNAAGGNAVVVLRIGGVTITDLVSAGGGTLALGVTGGTSLFIGATTATTMDNDEVWASTTLTAGGIALPAATLNTIICDDIIGTVGTADITAGVIELGVTYVPFTHGAFLRTRQI